ncbi:hypothetical protein cym2001_11600 [Pseudomonas sp. CYM-20-01]|nr:hypothetical protein cym2001_11600 [Pseudomonas sp. CYM-20-01]
MRGNGEADFASRLIKACNGIHRQQQGKRYTEVYQGHRKRPFPERAPSAAPCGKTRGAAEAVQAFKKRSRAYKTK